MIRTIEDQERNLEADKKRDSFNAVVTTIHIVAHEQEVCVWRLSYTFGLEFKQTKVFFL